MFKPALTIAEVAQTVTKRKFVSAVVKDNTQPTASERRQRDYVQPNEKIIIWDLRFTGMREKEIPLQFHARLETAISGVIRPKPGVSLKWKGRRIRGVNHAFRHDNMLNALPAEPVRGWHEKLWNEVDEDKHIIDINGDIKNTDFRAVIRFCCDRWNIELPEENQRRIGDL